jgi:hypothetical protein
MSLVDTTLPTREMDLANVQDQTKSYRDSIPGAPKPICTRQSYDGTILDDMYNNGLISPTTAHVEQAEQPPALPQKSALRASRLLNAFDLKAPAQPTVTETTPHDVYLSSEEDASSSADDFSDYDYESESEVSENGRRKSHEDTARVVSVVFMGRPSIVEVVGIRRSISPNSIEARRQSSLGSLSGSAASSATSATSSRRMSTSSTVASSVNHALPPRTSSMGLEMLNTKPTFLSIDPFAHQANTESIEEGDVPKTPKTPTAMFKKTLSLVRKRSRPMLNARANGSQTALTSPSVHDPSRDQLANVREEFPKHEEQTQTRTNNKPPPVTYNDILRSAKRNSHSVPSTPLSPVPHSPMSATPVNEKKASRILSGFSMGRRKSMKITGF